MLQVDNNKEWLQYCTKVMTANLDELGPLSHLGIFMQTSPNFFIKLATVQKHFGENTQGH